MPWFQFHEQNADKEIMKVTGTLPTPIPAREAISPLAKKKASGKVFDLMMEGQLLGKSQTTQAKDRLGEYLQNPTLAHYFLTWLNGR